VNAGTIAVHVASSDASERTMAKSATATQPDAAPKLRAGLQTHRRDVERLRGEIGDVQAALSAFVRGAFEPSAFDPEPAPVNESSNDDDDELIGW
jgi:hypothetical protein